MLLTLLLHENLLKNVVSQAAALDMSLLCNSPQ